MAASYIIPDEIRLPDLKGAQEHPMIAGTIRSENASSSFSQEDSRVGF
jgi:hypothetical protein